ncbi:MAG: hypothetical protein LBK71_12255 [Verrucomicrobiales bacterium]|jgi:hypothetical protein|nr:hypothetical protein [Verrucomicrobiales bacterium]
MKLLIYFTVASWLLSPALTVAQNTRSYLLDENITNKVPVAFGKGATTLMFPAPIDAIRQGRTLIRKPGEPAAALPGGIDFAGVYAPGASYFSLKATNANAGDMLTVIVSGKAYNIELLVADRPVFTAKFYYARKNAGGDAASVTPERSLELIKQAKAYDALHTYHPDSVQDVECFRPEKPLVIQYDGWTILVNRVWRFEQDDTLVFWVAFVNQTAAPILLNKLSTTVKVDGDDRYYPATFFDYHATLPPAVTKPDGGVNPSLVQGWFTVSGDGYGGRNWLQADNNWNVLIERK